MAGKPETAQRPGPPNSALQNVLVYVSGDGFSYTQQQQPPLSNAVGNGGGGAGGGGGGVVYPAGSPSMKSIGKVPTSLQTFYNANGFQNAIASTSTTNHVYPGPATVRNQQQQPPPGFTVKSREDGSFVAVMGGEVVFPRCDSVRSETAESSCSSLSSSCGGDSQPMQDVPPSANAVARSDSTNSSLSSSSSSSGALGVNVNNGSAVLGVNVNNNSNSNNGSGVQQPQQQCKPQDIPSVAAPFGWKRLLTNNIIIYVRFKEHTRSAVCC